MTHKNTHEIRFKVSPNNFKRIKSQAESHGLDVPNYMRFLSSAMMSGDYLPDTEIRALLLELGRDFSGVANNLNQITKQLNRQFLQNDVTGDTIDGVLRSVKSCDENALALRSQLRAYYAPFDVHLSQAAGVVDD